MYGTLRVAVVIPAHNEASLLPVTLAGIPNWIDHIIVVDDQSTDATVEQFKRATNPGLELIRHGINQGVGAAICSGYARARSLGVDATVVMGADNQMDPNEIHRLLDPIVEDRADYVKGNRMGHPELFKRMPWIRLGGNVCLTRLTRFATGYGELNDAQCGYTAINGRTLDRVDLGTLFPRYGFPNDLLAKLANLNARVEDQPVSPIYENESSELRIHRVALPILGILVRATLQRGRRWRRSRQALVLENGAPEVS